MRLYLYCQGNYQILRSIFQKDQFLINLLIMDSTDELIFFIIRRQILRIHVIKFIMIFFYCCFPCAFLKCALTCIDKCTCAKSQMYSIIQYLTLTIREAKDGLCCHRLITMSAFVRQQALRIRPLDSSQPQSSV